MHVESRNPYPYPPRLYLSIGEIRHFASTIISQGSKFFMGNTPSTVAGRSKDFPACVSGAPHTNPASRPPQTVQLDFDNMPFLQPPEDTSMLDGSSTNPASPLPPATSPPLVGTFGEPFRPQATVVNDYTVRLPSEGYRDHTVHDMDFFAAPAAAVAEFEAPSEDDRQPSHHAQSSISSQLSILSRRRSANGSPNMSPRSHRHTFTERFPSGQYEMIDAGVPPPVPPHFTFPEYITQKHTPETETALAAVDALEEDLDPYTERRPLRSRSRSLSRSLTRRKSLGSESIASGKSMTTDIYTRKCSSPALKSPESPSSLATTRSSESERSVVEPESPNNDEDTSFSLEGYNEGTTRLRVINLDKEGLHIDVDSPKARLSRDHIAQKSFVKSKAQLAEEEEQRLKALQKRYERYGHIYRAKGQT